MYSVAHTVDEHGKERWFVEDEKGDWIGEPFDTVSAAVAEVMMLEELHKMPDADWPGEEDYGPMSHVKETDG